MRKPPILTVDQFGFDLGILCLGEEVFSTINVDGVERAVDLQVLWLYSTALP